MIVRLLTALIFLLPLTGTAQQIVPLTTQSSSVASGFLVDALLSPGISAIDTSAQLVPVWISQDGHLLAIASLSDSQIAPIQPLMPALGNMADWRFIEAMKLTSGGLRWVGDQGLHAQAILAHYQPVNPLITWQCEGAIGASCMDIAQSQSNLALMKELRIDWVPTGVNFNLALGLSQLEQKTSYSPFLATILSENFGQVQIRDLLVQGAPPSFSSANSLQLQSSWHLGAETLLDVGTQVSHANIRVLNTGAMVDAFDLNQTTLSVGLVGGTWRGSIAGHVLSTNQLVTPLGKRWTSFDLGVSWRTPWQGELSVGAQNVWTAPLDAAAKDADASQNRTPYVQYRQDL